VEVLSVHNEELQRYADSYSTDSKLIEASISSALTHLDSIEGLDDIDIGSALQIDLETADQFTSGSGLAIDEISLDQL
jgi:hypothetical protein